MKIKLIAVSCLLALPMMAANSPNVIFLMADDLGFGDVGFNGNDLVQTPHLDRMANDGLRFTRFYSVGPVCSPTRACVQTGRHSIRFGMINVNVGKLPEGEINMAQIAKSQGYTTGHFGKWHLGTMTRDPELSGPSPASTAERYGPPWERNYDVTFTTETNIATWDPLDETGLRLPKHRVHFWSNGTEIKDDWKGSSEKIMMDRALEFVETAAANDTPFMTTIWFYGPHSPTRAGEELRALYPHETLGRQHYLGSITSLDREVGRLRQTLQELGIEKDTLIFFCSDNGPEGTGTPEPEYNPYGGVYYGEAGEFKGRKRYLYNGGVCVPAFAFWPGRIDAGNTSDAPVCTLDYMPTLCAVLGIEPPDDRPIDGTNILGLLEGEDWQRETFIPFASAVQSKSPTASIVSGGHKLLLWMDDDKPDELYDIQADASESRNLVYDEPAIAARLRTELLGWLESAEDSYEKGDYPGYTKQGRFIKVTP